MTTRHIAIDYDFVDVRSRGCALPLRSESVRFTYNPAHQPVLDSDKQVQESLRLFFETFTRTGSAM